MRNTVYKMYLAFWKFCVSIVFAVIVFTSSVSAVSGLGTEGLVNECIFEVTNTIDCGSLAAGKIELKDMKKSVRKINRKIRKKIRHIPSSVEETVIESVDEAVFGI